MIETEPIQEVRIRYRDEEEAPPGMTSVVIRLHMPINHAKPNSKDFELLPELLTGLGIATRNPNLSEEEQGVLEVCRKQIVNALERGGELPPMRLVEERLNPHCALLRCQVYVPKVVGDRAGAAHLCRQGISLANEVARSDGS